MCCWNLWYHQLFSNVTNDYKNKLFMANEYLWSSSFTTELILSLHASGYNPTLLHHYKAQNCISKVFSLLRREDKETIAVFVSIRYNQSSDLQRVKYKTFAGNQKNRAYLVCYSLRQMKPKETSLVDKNFSIYDLTQLANSEGFRQAICRCISKKELLIYAIW